jgi:hypothetical protein
VNKRFWLGALVVSVLVTAAAGFYVMTQVQNKEIIAMMPVQSAPFRQPIPAAASVVTDSIKVASSTVAVSAPAAEPSKNVEAQKTVDTPKRNILFSLPRPNAKAVYIVGDFNDWKEDVMVKKGKKWQRSVALKPGTYKYMFVVDKKQIRDPSNKLSSGGKSLITVKPLSSDK